MHSKCITVNMLILSMYVKVLLSFCGSYSFQFHWSPKSLTSEEIILFRRYRKISKSDYYFGMSVRPSEWRNSVLSGRIFMKFYEYFSKICRENSTFIKIWSEKEGGGGTLREDQYTYLVHFFLEGEMLQKKLYKSRYTYFMFNNIKSCFLWDKVQNYCPAGVVTEDTTAHAHCVLAS